MLNEHILLGDACKPISPLWHLVVGSRIELDVTSLSEKSRQTSLHLQKLFDFLLPLGYNTGIEVQLVCCYFHSI